MFVKICGLRDAERVNAAVDAGADAVGFVFYPGSVRDVAADQAQAACADVPGHVRRVAVMLHPEDADWQAVLSTFRPDVLQTDAGDFESLTVPASIERWAVHREGGELGTTTDTYVYEGASSGTGETVDWQQAARQANNGNMILAGGLNADNIAAAIAEVQPWGVDVSSGVESAPGQKDITRIQEFVTAAKAAGKPT